MFIKKEYSSSIEENKKQLLDELKEFSSNSDTNIALFSNAANHLKVYFGENVNWVGFYLANSGGNLDLGPFNGLPAVTYIENGKGVCGICLKNKETIIVDDVCSLPNHIVCDINSKSEICVPVKVDGDMIALLDIDAPKMSFFGQYKELLEEYISELQNLLAK